MSYFELEPFELVPLNLPTDVPYVQHVFDEDLQAWKKEMKMFSRENQQLWKNVFNLWNDLLFDHSLAEYEAIKTRIFIHNFVLDFFLLKNHGNLGKLRKLNNCIIMGVVNNICYSCLWTSFALIVLLFTNACQSEYLSSISTMALPSDLQCLSELPVQQLLKIQKSLKEMSNMSIADNESDDYFIDQNYENEELATADKRRGLGVKLNASADKKPIDQVAKETISALPLMSHFSPMDMFK